MTYQVLESPIDTLRQQSKCTPEHDESGQSIINGLVVDRISEPWPNKCVRYLKPNAMQYTRCAGCHAVTQMPTANVGPVHKAMLKITKSMENIRGQLNPRSRPSSPGSSSTAASFSSNNSLFQGDEIAPPMPSTIDNSIFNHQGPKPSFKQHMTVSMDKLNTKLPPAPRYDLYGDHSALTSTTASSYGTTFLSPFSAQALSSASPLSPTMVSPSSEFSWLKLPHPDGADMFPCASTSQTLCDAQPFGPFSYQSSYPNLQDHAISQEGQTFLEEEHLFFDDSTHMQLDAMNMGGMMPDLASDGNNTHVDYPDLLKELQDQVDSCVQEWTHPGPLYSDMPMVSHREFCDGLEVVTATTADHAAPGLVSPTSFTDISMTEASAASEATTSPTSPTSPASTAAEPSSLRCPECPWRPDIKAGNRSFAKLRQAVEKHFKRNHRSQDHPCPACPQSFRNRPDNVKPHVKRKHPEVFARLYPQKKKTAVEAAVAAQHGASSSTSGITAGSIVKTPGAKPAAIKRSGRYVRSQRGFAPPEEG